MTTATDKIRNDSGILSLIVFSFSLFLSAALMFAIQPMTGKMLLPLVGGTPAGWIVAMSFFQMMLLAGYFLAHALSRQNAFQHGMFYIICLGIGAILLPVDITRLSDQIGQQPNAFDILKILAIGVGVPFIALSATSSTLQRLFTFSGHASARDPYFLYAASNIGSFFGLLFYPLWAEPHLTIPEQTGAVSIGYITLMLLAAVCLILTARRTNEKTLKASVTVSERPNYLLWAALAFFPSALMSGVTIYITSDLVSAPMLWVLPLSIYLLTFVIAFSKRPILSLQSVAHVTPWIVVITLPLMIHLPSSWAALFMAMLAFTFVTLMCHLRLASLRPLDHDSKNLTAFYLMLSIGGALGGALNAFVFPYVLVGAYEFRILLASALILHPAFQTRNALIKLAAVLMVVAWAQVSLPRWIAIEYLNSKLWFLTALVVTIYFAFKHLKDFRSFLNFIVCLSLLFIIQAQTLRAHEDLFRTRNFYGVISVRDEKINIDGETLTKRIMSHGTTIHGSQVLDPRFETKPSTYFTTTGPFGDIIKNVRPKNVAVLGLGAGSINCHEAPHRKFTFIEIDPAVVDMAHQYFTYLSKCSGGKSTIITGDGRLEMKSLPDHSFDLIVMDAFTSDAIPTHLITQEAFADYQQKLTKNGFIAVNISSRYFALWQPIAKTAQGLGLEAIVFGDFAVKDKNIGSPSVWMLLSENKKALNAMKVKGWVPVMLDKETRPWTDNYSNLMDTLSLRGATKLMDAK